MQNDIFLSIDYVPEQTQDYSNNILKT